MTSPRPWRVVYSELGVDGWVENIVDANGNRVIETDSGFYSPKSEDAELIVAAVNAYAGFCRHCGETNVPHDGSDPEHRWPY